MTTVAWSSLVGKMVRGRLGEVGEITGHHPHADMVKVNDQWMQFADFEAFFEFASCEACGSLLTREAVDALPEP